MSLRLSPKLAHLFTSTVRSQGQYHYNRGSVRIRSGTARAVRAVVQGSPPYEAELELVDDDLTLYCECPYFESDGPCKHLWATVLAAEDRGYLAKVEPRQKVAGIGFEDIMGEFDQIQNLFAFPKPAPPMRRVPRPPVWKKQIASLFREEASPSRAEWPTKRQILYVVELGDSIGASQISLSLWTRDRKVNGDFGRVARLNLQRSQIQWLPVEADREILSGITGASQYYNPGAHYGQVPTSNTIPEPLSRKIIPLVAGTGRCYLRSNSLSEEFQPLAWDGGGPWRFELELQVNDKPQGVGPVWVLTGVLRRGDERVNSSAPSLVTQGGHLVVHGMVAELADGTNFGLLSQLRKIGKIQIPADDGDELLSTLLSTPGLPRLEVPEQLRYEEVSLRPHPCLRIRGGDRQDSKAKLTAELSFDYGGRVLAAADKSGGFYDAVARRFVRRDAAAEQEASTFLNEVGVRYRAASYYEPEPGWELAPAKLPRAARMLVEAGWNLDADGKVFRRPGAFHIDVSSGVDWFELNAGVEYGLTSAKLPELLEALRRGESMVKLDDGSYGMLPEQWLRRIGMFAGMGTAEGTPEDRHIRFRPSQAGLLDALLAAQPEATFDKNFARVRDELRDFHGVDAVAQPVGFVGHLRDYQREGVGWMGFLRRFSFGGCLADDMGVGKTAQVLAMLEQRRELRVAAKQLGEQAGEQPGEQLGEQAGQTLGPSLVVAPKSLVFNWKQEAERFTPQLRVLDYTGLSRTGNDFTAYDLILTTYGTLRRDAARLKDVEFDYVVLDEAQAVKNATTESAKAVRLLRSRHRLALSGTPVENHLGELWSLFEFLNPGMLGVASAFQGAFKPGSGAGRNSLDEETRKLLNHALRPFILRRTKQQVVRELPDKTEQTLYCELEPAQRKLYNELRQHYRDSLLARIATEGLAKSKIMVLEALLRLRQAACHPGLIDVKRSGEPSAKLELLLEQLREVLESGHKALVFSQFTSLLKIVRDRLDSEGVVYEYLDGKTQDRQAHVERFQSDADCMLFLISLKAGGLGLNLTAAEYVFLLDPWWNPAVEAQAVDRAHRIGQTRPVFAYRLIARDTVEEKVLELQKSKRDLADAIIGEDNALIRDLRREDLELLLS